jgi:hypothetical protein
MDKQCYTTDKDANYDGQGPNGDYVDKDIVFKIPLVNF